LFAGGPRSPPPPPTTSLKTFHDEFLDWGSLPPRVIAWGMGLGERPF
jgi:hypothetical protein